MNQAQRESVEKYAKEETDKLGVYAWPHVKRVSRLSLQMAEMLDEGRVDLDVLEVSALLHDIAKHFEEDDAKLDHGVLGAEMAEDFLKKCGFKREIIQAVSHAIRAHTHSVEPDSVEAKVLHDADYVDKVGAVGLAAILIKACLSDTTIEGVLNAFESETNGKSRVAKHINQVRNPHTYTETARAIVENRNQVLLTYFRQLKIELELSDLESKKNS